MKAVKNNIISGARRLSLVLVWAVMTQAIVAEQVHDDLLHASWKFIDNQNQKLADHIKFATPEDARKMLQTEDAFTRSWSRFDIEARLHSRNGTRAQLLEFIGEQVVPWTDEEHTYINATIETIDGYLDSLNINLPLPEAVYLIKTTSDEEGSAVAYTRANYIVFQDGLDFADEWNLGRLLLHELFHVISRNDPDFRMAMYDIISFKFMDPVLYPDSVADLRITNPDAPQTDTYIKLAVDTDSVDCMMVIYASQAYPGEGDFFDFVNIGFMALDENMLPLIRDNSPVIYEMNEVSGFFERIGNNTSYIIHPEEIMADNFSYAITGKVGLPDPRIVEDVLAVLRD